MYASETFGRMFWIDDDYEFKSCPLNVDGTGDYDVEDYESDLYSKLVLAEQQKALNTK